MSKTRIMIVEDENVIALELTETLGMLGYHVVLTASTGEAAIKNVEKENVDIALIDINLGLGVDGIEVGKAINALMIPFIYVTAYSDEDTLRSAASTRPFGYLVKPFDIETLNATIQMALRKSEELKAVQSEHSVDNLELSVEDLTLDVVARRVVRAGAEIELTSREFDLLRFLVEHAGEVLTRTRILDKVWHDYRTASSNVVDVYIRYLREKIDEGHAPKLIKTVRNRGYVIEP